MAINIVDLKKEILNFSMEKIESTATIPTRLLSLNKALSIGGFPVGGIVLIHGPYAGGKTLIGLETLHNNVVNGGYSFLFDAEYAARDKVWYSDLGFNMNKIGYVQPDTYEDCVERVISYIDSFNAEKEASLREKKKFDKHLVIMIDSINKLIPEEEKAKFQVKKCYPIRALFNSLWLDYLVPKIHGQDILIVLIAQESMKLDALPFAEDAFNVKGGRRLMYDALVVLRVLCAEKIKDKETKQVIYKKHQFIVMKNKFGKDREIGFFYLNLKPKERGFDFAPEIVDVGISMDFVKKDSGSRYLFKDIMSEGIRGKEAFIDHIRKNDELREKIVAMLDGEIAKAYVKRSR